MREIENHMVSERVLLDCVECSGTGRDEDGEICHECKGRGKTNGNY